MQDPKSKYHLIDTYILDTGDMKKILFALWIVQANVNTMYNQLLKIKRCIKFIYLQKQNKSNIDICAQFKCQNKII